MSHDAVTIYKIQGEKKKKKILQHQDMNVIEYVTESWEVTLILVTAAYQQCFHITL